MPAVGLSKVRSDVRVDVRPEPPIHGHLGATFGQYLLEPGRAEPGNTLVRVHAECAQTDEQAAEVSPCQPLLCGVQVGQVRKSADVVIELANPPLGLLVAQRVEGRGDQYRAEHREVTLHGLEPFEHAFQPLYRNRPHPTRGGLTPLVPFTERGNQIRMEHRTALLAVAASRTCLLDRGPPSPPTQRYGVLPTPAPGTAGARHLAQRRPR